VGAAAPDGHVETDFLARAASADDARAAVGAMRLSDVKSALDALIAARAGADPASSYVAKLLAATPARRAQKVGEEGVEVALAAAIGDDAGLRGEAADLLFHLLVLLRGADIPLADVIGELARRHHSRN
jgi:phosphoribosyl-ATP pyrophosphohydrolase